MASELGNSSRVVNLPGMDNKTYRCIEVGGGAAALDGALSPGRTDRLISGGRCS